MNKYAQIYLEEFQKNSMARKPPKTTEKVLPIRIPLATTLNHHPQPKQTIKEMGGIENAIAMEKLKTNAKINPITTDILGNLFQGAHGISVANPNKQLPPYKEKSRIPKVLPFK
jgi:hypothetical protein